MLLHCWWECKMIFTLENGLALMKVNMYLPYNPANPIPQVFIQDENICPQKDFKKNAHSNCIRNCKNLKHPKCPSIGEWINCSIFMRWNTILQYKGTADRYNNMGAPPKDDTDWKKSYAKENILHAVVYVKFHNRWLSTLQYSWIKQ